MWMTVFHLFYFLKMKDMERYRYFVGNMHSIMVSTNTMYFIAKTSILRLMRGMQFISHRRSLPFAHS
ncbi:hypothetical protein MPC4_80165 [Methylocella tundrae]|uniref:Uncharacterized protein n=1 Tax=Methylocella tundrae TaxID=227605 RepID=A0A8B6MC35_METTU|nr:hypothetical protein MPC1_70006 [Methylocella tundrae]VTZ52494.1 hypothetical protein MPC4_80165 [Methylocella tundrae]